MRRQEDTVRGAIVLLAVSRAMLTPASGVALAVTRLGTDGDDTLRDSLQEDRLIGYGGDDRIYGGAGADWVDAVKTCCSADGTPVSRAKR